jgi:WD40 repeat protein
MSEMQLSVHHSSPITTVDARSGSIATGGYDGRVILWTADLLPKWSFCASDLINQVAFSPDGEFLAVASANAYVIVLRVLDGLRVHCFGPFGDDVNAVAWHPSGMQIVCVMDASDTIGRIIKLESGVELCHLNGHRHGIFAVAFENTGLRLVTAAEDATARIWDARTGVELACLEHPGDPETVSWSPIGPWVATGCDDGGLRIWDANSAELLRHTKPAGAALRFVKFTDDGKRLLAGSYDGHLRLLDSTTLQRVADFQAPFQWERAAAQASDAVIVGSFGGEPIIHKPNQKPSRPFPTFGINSISVSFDARSVLIGRDDGAVLDVAKNAALYFHDSIVNTVAISDDGSRVASGDYLGGITIYDLNDGVVLTTKQVRGGPINSLVWLSEGRFASAGYDGTIRIWSPEGCLLSELSAHKGPIKSLAFNQELDVLVAGSSDNTISGWQADRCIYRIDSPDLVLVNSVSAVRCSTIFASASRDGLVRLWCVETGKHIRSLPRLHSKSVKAISCSLCGRFVLSGSYDGTAILWSLDETGDHKSLALHGKPGVPAVGFSSTNAVTAGWDGSVGVWSLTGELIGQHWPVRHGKREIAVKGR